MSQVLQLKNLNPLSQGSSRFVFQHPNEPDCIIKIMRGDVLEDRFGTGSKWYKMRRRYRHLVSYIREIQEYLAVYASLDKDLPFLQEIVGFVKTDLGLGLVSKAVRNEEGGLAPSLSELINSHQINETVEVALETFLNQILCCDVIVSDLNLGNIVYTHSEELGNHFVLIDGLGNNNLIPFKAMSKQINYRSKLGRFKKLYKLIERAKKDNGHPLC